MDKHETKITEIKETLYKLNFFVNIILAIYLIGVLAIFICAIVFGGMLWLSFAESVIILIIVIAPYKLIIKLFRLTNDIEDTEEEENISNEEIERILVDADKQKQISELLSDDVDIASDEEIEELLLNQMKENN